MLTLDSGPIRVLAPPETLDYFDSQSAQLGRDIGPLEAWNLIMEDPQPLLKMAFRVRDTISAQFGVKKIGGFTGERAAHAVVGDYLDFFLIEHSDDQALVLTERDRHLDVMTCIARQGYAVSITSSVKVHNLFGRAYMLPVGIAHKWIVRTMLRRLKAKVALAPA